MSKLFVCRRCPHEGRSTSPEVSGAAEATRLLPSSL
jgi:hypothetical protein